MNILDVQYFAMLRDKAGIQNEKIETTAKTYRELYYELDEKFKFGLPFEFIQLAVNDEFVSINSLVVSGSKVVFIPPVAGG